VEGTRRWKEKVRNENENQNERRDLSRQSTSGAGKNALWGNFQPYLSI
jgi:hypothetical protein